MNSTRALFSAAKSVAMMFGVEQISESMVRLEDRSGMVDDELRLENARFSGMLTRDSNLR